MNELRSRLEASLSTTYRLERELGSGGMAVVYLAQDLRHKRRVALKVLRPEVSALIGPARFLREIETLANLTHPHILPLHDSGEADGLLYYVMPYVEGESLRERLLREKQLPLDDALRIAREVADALSHAHARGVIHRDIKPENILLSGGHALVADFGIAAAIDFAGGSRLTETGIAMGTPAYMSPEQALSERTIDARADIYALGCVMYEMLAGEPPFTGPTAQVIIARRLQEPVPSLRRVREVVPAAIDRTVTKALARLPADRFATAERFAEALAAPQGTAKLAGGNAHTVEASPGESAPPAKRQLHQRTVIVTGVILVAGICAGAVWLARSGADTDANRVVVVPFTNLTGADTLDTYGFILADAIASGLIGTGTELTSVVPPSVVMEATQATGAGRVSISPTVLTRETRAGLVLTGTFRRAGADSLSIQAHIQDVEHNRALAPIALVTVAKQIDGIEPVLERVKIALSSRVDPRLVDVAPLSDLPMSWEGYREYASGMELYWRGDQDQDPEKRGQALRHFYRAVELDSSAAALLMAAQTEWGETFNLFKVDTLLQTVKRRVSSLRPHDQAHYDRLRAWLDGNLESALRAARRRAEMGGSLGGAAVQDALKLNHVDQAYAWTRSLLTNPNFREGEDVWEWLTQILHIRGQFKKELKQARKGSTEAGAQPENLRNEIRALAARADVVELRARLDMLKTLDPASPHLLVAARELRWHGHAEAAQEFSNLAERWYREAVQRSPTRDMRVLLAEAMFDNENWEEARSAFSALAAESLPPGSTREHWRAYDALALGYLGIDAARRGERRLAEAMIDSLGRLDRPYLLGANHHWRARIAAQLGDCRRTVQFLRAGLDKGSSYTTDTGKLLSEVPQFAKVRGCAAFRDFMKPRK